ncbi:LuxR C-terminal-related transcriptional regulator [Novosphingobium taihuense]|uniref:DNA-binding NarL/FixJ family response regulator n=1 Tax=Novosphingobium taihuense TaxID=260085 RepID=A0A7W7ABA0_9SPHN|nr:response regulator transcription factor [Novosphingobium taihuense]MBB4613062.1 DNA-binding NarL/FixJ family response regulator [Novosphingobium taihuense]TWH85205.1 LuxR family two component transcriptional regulator [Novosphingobium taihuense]
MRRCLICDDHPLMVDALRLMLQSRWPECEFLVATDYPSAIGMAECSPDLVVADLSMPGREPMSGMRAVRTAFATARLIVFSGQLDDRILVELLSLQVDGILAKSEAPALMIPAIELVLAGGRYLPQRIAELAVRRDADPSQGLAPRLSPRQKEIVQLLAKGRSNKEIAQALRLSPATVKTHVAQAMATLSASTRAEAAARATALGLA